MVAINRSLFAALVLSGAAFVAGLAPASAQEIAESHLKAARAAITSIHATDSMDAILPQANVLLKQELIQKNPDREADIIQMTDEETLKLAARRGDLEKEVATAFARAFTEQELTEIANFHNSATGKKFLADSPIVGREVEKAVNIWQIGIARDLSQAVAKRLAETAPPPAPAPAQEAAPAEAPAAPAAPALQPPKN